MNPQSIIAVDDVTPEKLGSLMSANGQKLAILSAEGGIFDIMSGRYARKAVNLDLFLKAHAGDAWSTYRMSRTAESMTDPALTVCVTVQPEVIKMVGKNDQLRGRGLLARFLYSQCKPQAGFRPRSKVGLQDDIVASYGNHIIELLHILQSDDCLVLSSAAEQIWDSFYNSVEAELRMGGCLYNLKDWGSKLPGCVARIAGLLHAGTYGSHAQRVIEADILNNAMAIGQYYMEHATATFGSMGDSPTIELAKQILESIKRNSIKKFKGRDIIRQTGIKTMKDVNLGLSILLERCYIREQSAERTGKGRPEGITYLVNPQIYADKSDKRQKIA